MLRELPLALGGDVVTTHDEHAPFVDGERVAVVDAEEVAKNDD